MWKTRGRTPYGRFSLWRRRSGKARFPHAAIGLTPDPRPDRVFLHLLGTARCDLEATRTYPQEKKTEPKFGLTGGLDSNAPLMLRSRAARCTKRRRSQKNALRARVASIRARRGIKSHFVKSKFVNELTSLVRDFYHVWIGFYPVRPHTALRFVEENITGIKKSFQKNRLI